MRRSAGAGLPTSGDSDMISPSALLEASGTQERRPFRFFGLLLRFLEQVDPLSVGRCDPRDSALARDFLGAIIHQRVPEDGSTDREAREPRNTRGGRQPLAHLLVVLAAAQDNTADFVAPAALCGCDELL